MIKRITIALLAISMLLSCACNTSGNTGDGDNFADKNIASLFLDAVRNGEYVEAYSFMSSKFTVPENDDGTDNASFISVSDFEQRYKTVFDLIGVNDFTYELKEDTVDGTKKTVNYTLTYDTEYADKLTFDFQMNAVAERGAWKVVWSTTLILPDLTENDTLVRARLRAKRGDITAQGKSIASTVNLVSVYIVPSEVIGRDNLIEYIMNNEEIDKAAAELRLNAYTNDYELLYYAAPERFDALSELLQALLEVDTSGVSPNFTDNPVSEPNADQTLKPDVSQSLHPDAAQTDEPDATETPKPAPTKTPEQMEAEAVEKAFNSLFNDFMLIEQYYPGELSIETIEALEAIEGVHIDTSNYGTARYYPYGNLLAHTLGYVGYANADEVEKYNEGRLPSEGLYTEDSIVGKSGIEQIYETELRGKDGYYFFIRSSDGTNKKTLYRKEQEDGLDIQLTVDLELQLRTEEMLDLVMFGEDTAGAVIVMNPKTGAVEAIASYPSFDLNEFTTGISSEAYNELLEKENTPLYNRTIQGLYPPGSTFKAFTAAAALDLHVMDRDYIFNGTIVDDYWTPTGYGAWHWPAIKRTRVFHRTEPMNMTNSMLHSDNIYFANAALKIGAENFINYLDAMGMDSSIPFELSVRKAQLLNKGMVMNYKLLADSGYGQGEVLVTPLQLAAMFCAFCNDGDIPMPYLTDAYYRTNGVDYECVYKNEPETWLENVISDSAIGTIIPMLQGVVDPEKNGTGRSLRVTNCDVAGKTGSAEIGSDKSRIISWFAGFRLNVDEADERVVIVMLEIPDTSDYTSLKFQIARELLEFDDSVDPNLPPEEDA
ncbi:MAG: hypothetical protein J1E60_08295 [Christensenellaceae bacterium]|nr:hypothetical protein [Christensenellaceae bacterium]